MFNKYKAIFNSLNINIKLLDIKNISNNNITNMAADNEHETEQYYDFSKIYETPLKQSWKFFFFFC